MENNDELMPREKLLAFGAKALSDYELLAIFYVLVSKVVLLCHFLKMY